MSGACPPARTVAALRLGRLPSPRPSSTRGSRPGTTCWVPGDTAGLAPFSPSRLWADSAPPRAGAFAPGPPRPTGLLPPSPRDVRGFPAPAEASPERCGARLFVLSLVTRVGIRSRTGVSPADVMGTRAEEGPGAPLSSPPLPPHPWSALAAAEAHVGSGRVLAGDPQPGARILRPRRWISCGAGLRDAPTAPGVFSTFGSVGDPQNFCPAVKIDSWVYILFMFHNLFNIFNGFFY